MKILAIDTAFPACLVAIVDTTNGQEFVRAQETTRGQSEILVPMIDAVIKEAGFDYADLDLIAVDVGPGSFTGVRVGIAAARGFGLALGRPVQGVLSTDALYATWLEQNQGSQGLVRVAVDTGRQDYFVAGYHDTHAMPMDQSRIEILLGDSVVDEAGILIGTHPQANLTRPDPVVFARLAARLYQDDSYLLQGKAEPVYLRDAEVSISKQRTRVLLDPLIVNT